MAVLIRYGIALWPGIFLGSLALHAWLLLELGATTGLSISLALIAASGSTLQSLLGYYLCSRHSKVDFNLPTPKDIFSFMLLAGPIACLNSAAIHTSCQQYPNAINYDDFIYVLFARWAGESVGVIFFTPITLCLLCSNQKIWSDRRYYVTLPLAILLVGGITLLWLSHQWSQEQEQNHHQFEDGAKRFIKRLQTQVTLSLSELSAIERFFISSNFVSQTEFQQFTHSMLQENKSLKGLSWNPLILDKHRQSFITSMQKRGGPQFQFIEKDLQGHMVKAATRPFYIVVKYIEPYQKNQRAQGFDVASELSRKKGSIAFKR